MPLTNISTVARDLRRRTTSGSWVPEIDGLRFLATMAVLLFHIQGELGHHGLHRVPVHYAWLAAVLSTGNRGVQLFFVISGYILGRPFAAHYLFGKQRPSIGQYLVRRVTRLQPPYLFNLVVCAIVYGVAFHAGWKVVLSHFAASAFYMHHFFFGSSPITLDPVAWSLEIEVQFYLIAPLLTLVFLIHSATTRRAVLVLAMLASAWAQVCFHLSNMTLVGQLQYFLAGLLLVDLMTTLFNKFPHHRYWDLVSLVGWPLVFLPKAQAIQFWLPPLIVLLYVAALRGQWMTRLLRLRWVTLFGGMCYTIYLWHPLVLSGAQRLLDRMEGLMPTDYALYLFFQATIDFSLVALTSIVLFAFLERPCMDPEWPRKLARHIHRLLPPSVGSVSNATASLEES